MNLRKLIKREIFITCMSVLVLITSFSLITYALFFSVSEGTNNSITYGDISMEFCNTTAAACESTIDMGKTIGITDGSPVLLYPEDDLTALSKTPYRFKLTNDGDYTLDIQIRLIKETDPTTNSSYSSYTAVDNSNIKVAIGEYSTAAGYTPGVKSYFDVAGNDNILATYTLAAGESKIFNLWAWLKSDAPNTAQGTHFIADIQLTGEHKPGWETTCNEEKNTIGCKLLSDNTVKTNADFTKTSYSANEYGLYQDEENKRDVYYFRGGDHCENASHIMQNYTTQSTCEAVSGNSWVTLNNNIIYNNTCWQIIRTNKDGSIRVIYNGVPNSGQCTSTGTNAQVGTSAFNTKTRTINEAVYSIWTDASSVGYTFGSPEGETYTDYTGTGLVTETSTITYGQKVGTGYSLNSQTGIFTLTGVQTVSASVAPSTTNLYTCNSTSTTCTYLYKVASGTTVTHNSGTNYTLDKTYRVGANWSKSEVKATSDELDSTIKTTLETWYTNNLETVTSDIEDAGYCNDRTLINNTLGYGSSAYYEAYGRLVSTKTPSLDCKRTKDLYTTSTTNGNGLADKKVGLITADEVAMAGSIAYTTETKNNYLYTGQNYWTISPYIFNPTDSSASAWYLNSSGFFSNYRVRASVGVRPVISLIMTKTISSGTGSKTNPYIVG